jgi:hypothetical protein
VDLEGAVGAAAAVLLLSQGKTTKREAAQHGKPEQSTEPNARSA